MSSTPPTPKQPQALVEAMARFAREEGLPGLRLDPHEPYESQMEERLGKLSRRPPVE